MLPSDTFWLTIGLVVGAVVGLVIASRVTGTPSRRVAVALACTHLGAVLAVTLLPLPIAAEPFAVPYETVQLEPLGTIRLLVDGSQGLRQLGGNLLLLAPLGVLLPIAWRPARPFPATVLFGFLASLAIELLQFAFGVLVGELYRVVDIDDVLLNTAGVVLGRVVFSVVWVPWELLRSRRPDRSRV